MLTLFGGRLMLTVALQTEGEGLYTRYPIVARARAKVSCIQEEG